MDTAIIMFPVLVIILILMVAFINQRGKYQRLKETMEDNLKGVKGQENVVKKLEKDMRQYIMGGKGVRDWTMLKKQINDLSELPGFTEENGEYVVRTHLSRAKKNYVQVSGITDGIKVAINPKDELPLTIIYATPEAIDLHGLKVNYKDSILEIRAPKSIKSNEKLGE